MRAVGKAACVAALLCAGGLGPAWAQKQPQAIIFTPPLPSASQTLTGIEFFAAASSGQPVSVTTNTTGVCSHVTFPPLGRRVLFLTRPGLCTVTATQAGNEAYEPVSLTVAIDVSLRQLEVTFYGVPPIPAPYGESFDVAAATGNLGYIPIMSASGACTISGSAPPARVTMRSSTGDCVLTASHPGNESAEVIPKSVVVPAAKRPLLVAAAMQAKFQGTPDPALAYTVAAGSLVAGDAFTGAPARDAGEAPGIYQVHQANLSPGPHYEMTFLRAPFAVVPLELTGPSQPVRLGSAVTAAARFPDLASPAEPSCAIDWNDPALATSVPGTVAKHGGVWTCTFTHTYSAAGVYGVDAAISDPDSGSALREVEVVVYGPDSAVSGGGWFEPTGAASAALAGRLHFALESSYGAGGSTPTGRLEIRSADAWFLGLVQEWLVVDGSKARLRGVGITHAGQVRGFEISAAPGQGLEPARLRLVLWSNGAISFDSQPGAPLDADPATPLGGGAITIRR
jgi:hypothetical protein